MFVWHKKTIVAEKTGNTRDKREFEYKDRANELKYIIGDSGWLDFWIKEDSIADDIIDRTKKAIDESDLLIWIIEYDRFTELDEKILKILKKKSLSRRSSLF